ncbi:MAG: zinc-finger domain-containing protein [Burkholderia sp.]|nr:zinc-finger domain-containing protein [Burkholderia sp.]
MSDIKQMLFIELKEKDLPAYCPNPSMSRSGIVHPRIYIDVSHGEEHCPYCGTRYRLKRDKKNI